MKMFVPALALVLGLVGTAAAVEFHTQGGGGGTVNMIPGQRDACWSEPPDLNGLIGSSEQILMYGLESEIANDFVVPSQTITKAIWGWAWYDESWCDDHPATPGFNIRFYEAGDCVPGAIFADLSITSFTEEFLGCQYISGIDAMYKATTDVAVGVVPGQTYWFGMQVKDHAFPPQAGRLGTGAVTNCESAFKSAYFGYPDWTPVDLIFGISWDASQEFECGATPVQRTDWSRIKSMYR